MGHSRGYARLATRHDEIREITAPSAPHYAALHPGYHLRLRPLSRDGVSAGPQRKDDVGQLLWPPCCPDTTMGHHQGSPCIRARVAGNPRPFLPVFGEKDVGSRDKPSYDAE